MLGIFDTSAHLLLIVWCGEVDLRPCQMTVASVEDLWQRQHVGLIEDPRWLLPWV